MKERIEQLLEEVNAFSATSLDEVEQLRIKILGTKGELKSLFKINPDKAIGIALIHEQSIETLEEEGLSLEGFNEHKIFKL